ncbi:MAG: hypothetical protein ASARMPREDX12_007886 [Alectoria sarmentosa]|nr:MAG: hypothetical protein ASARMPREDX12_007886 [Alectoria sarmentosa]
MFCLFQCLIQAIVGKGQRKVHSVYSATVTNASIGLYEQFINRQTVDEVHGKVDLACDQRHARTSQSHDLPHALSLRASPPLKGGDAYDTPPKRVSATNSASATSSLQSRASSSITLRPNPLLKSVEPALAPDYNVVHNHCCRITGDLESGDPAIMQSYAYGPLDVGPAIGFQAPRTHRRVRAPTRKVTDLESLPPLSSEVAAVTARRVKVREQAGILAGIREAQAKDSEAQRRANRAAQMKIPPYVAHISTSYSAKDLEAALLTEPPLTPLIRLKRKPLQTQPDQQLGQTGHQAGDTPKQGRVRCAPKPTPQPWRDSNALGKKSRRGKQTNLRNASKGV